MDPQVMPEPGRRDRVVSVALFFATLLCVYWVYGTQWLGGDPFRDPATARGAGKFAAGLMGILLAHEMGHYLVARRHGFRLSLPYFLPAPMAFGTFGAIIRLKSLPRDRTGLLEMGAAGPLSGFVVALVLLVVGLPHSSDPGMIELILPPGVDALPLPALPVEHWMDAWLERPPLSWILPELPPPDTLPFTIMANPPVMDLLGWLLLGAPPGRYASLDPFAMAGWVGCLITAINLLPVGQLDGGHIFNALSPRAAMVFSRLGVLAAFLAGAIWPGWAVWGLLLLVLRAWRSLPVPLYPPPTTRARIIALLAVGTFLLCFMPRPVELENVPISQIRVLRADGSPVVAPSAP